MLDRGQRRRRVVELAASRDDVDARTVAVENNRGSELLVRADATLEQSRQLSRQPDRVALDGDVDVEPLRPEQDVAHRATHQVDALVSAADSCDRLA